MGDAAPPGLPRRAARAAPALAAGAVRPAALEAVVEVEPPHFEPDDPLPRAPSRAKPLPELAPPQEDDSAEAIEDDSVEPRFGRAGMLRLARGHVGVLGVIIVVALVFTGSRLMAAQGHEVDAAPATPSLSAAQPSVTPSPTPSPRQIWVHVLGAVASPGVVGLPEGSRVADAIAAAGGLLPDADPAELNLAQPLPDGAQLIIGTVGAPRGELRVGDAQSAASGGGAGASEGGGQPTLNLNTATQAQLETLPGIGPATASKIIAWREANGGFTRVEELQEVDGIGPKTYAQLEPLVHV